MLIGSAHRWSHMLFARYTFVNELYRINKSGRTPKLSCKSQLPHLVQAVDLGKLVEAPLMLTAGTIHVKWIETGHYGQGRHT